MRLSHFFIVAVVVRELRQGYGAARGPTPKAAVGTAIASTSARDFICRVIVKAIHTTLRDRIP